MTIKLCYRRDPTNKVDPKTGAIIDLRKVDRNFTTELKPHLINVTDGDIDLSPFATETNQYNLNACAGNATADSVEIISAVDEANLAASEGRPASPPTQLSRLFVYSMARTITDDGTGNSELGVDDGTYIRTCFETLSDFGICSEDMWPYDTSKVKVSPSILALRQAAGHRIHSYYRIDATGDSLLTEIVSALRAQHPVVFGTEVDEAFMNFGGPELVNKPQGPTAGGHAMIIVGYVNGMFKIKNSWGKEWRDNGYCFFTPDYLTWAKSWDFWVPTTGTVFKK